MSDERRGCWVAHTRAGEFDDGDRVSHFDDLAGVERYIDELLRQRGMVPDDLLPMQNAEPCHMATSVCGYHFDDDGEGPEHFDTADLLNDALLDAGWSTTADGKRLCPAGGCECWPLRFPETDGES